MKALPNQEEVAEFIILRLVQGFCLLFKYLFQYLGALLSCSGKYLEDLSKVVEEFKCKFEKENQKVGSLDIEECSLKDPPDAS